MKKYISLVLITTSLVFSACSIDWNGENEKKIAELEKQTQNDLFNKRQECIKMKEDILVNNGNFVSSLSIFSTPSKQDFYEKNAKNIEYQKQI